MTYPKEPYRTRLKTLVGKAISGEVDPHEKGLLSHPKMELWEEAFLDLEVMLTHLERMDEAEASEATENTPFQD